MSSYVTSTCWLLLLLLLRLGLAHLTGLEPEPVVGIGTFDACPHLVATSTVAVAVAVAATRLLAGLAVAVAVPRLLSGCSGCSSSVSTATTRIMRSTNLFQF